MFGRLYLRCKVAVSTMILLDRVKDSAVNNTRSGRYKGLKCRETRDKKEMVQVTELVFVIYL